MARSTLNFVLILLLFLLSVSTLWAQSTLIRLEGDIQDAGGRPLAGAAVTAEDESTSLKVDAVSDDLGRYVFPALPPGTYTVTVKANGFKAKARRHLEILQPGTMRTSFKLSAGDSTKTDTETAARESRSITDAQMAGGFSERDLNSLPLLSRDPLSLVIYAGGVQIVGGNESSSTVNGNRQGSNSVKMDGVSVGDPVNPRLELSLTATNPDAIREVQVVTAGAKAEYGQVSGGQVALLSRTGGKTWSGNLFDYFRNSTLSANDFFNNASNTSKPRFLQNLFGGSVSGPLKEQTFLFANFEGGITDQKIRRDRQVLSATAKPESSNGTHPVRPTYKPTTLWRTTRESSESIQP